MLSTSTNTGATSQNLCEGTRPAGRRTNETTEGCRRTRPSTFVRSHRLLLPRGDGGRSEPAVPHLHWSTRRVKYYMSAVRLKFNGSSFLVASSCDVFADTPNIPREDATRKLLPWNFSFTLYGVCALDGKYAHKIDLTMRGNLGSEFET